MEKINKDSDKNRENDNNFDTDVLSVERINVISDFQVEFGYEDHTLMTPLSDIISLNQDSNKTEIVGYSKSHTSDNSIILRVQFEDQQIQNAQHVLTKTIEGCESIMKITDIMLHKLKDLA